MVAERTKWLKIRLTEKEHDTFMAIAKAQGLSLSSWIRLIASRAMIADRAILDKAKSSS